MKFQLTEEQQRLRDEVRQYAQDEIRPQAIELDQAEEHPTEILNELSDRGYTGITIPETYGGMGEGMVELALIIEELAAALMPVAGAVALHLGVAEAIQRFGTDEQRDTYLPSMASYDTVGVLGMSEQNAGSNKLEMETTAKREGDEWVLNGHKQWLTNFQGGDYVLTYAKTGPESERPHNITAFLVSTDRFDVEKVWDTLGSQTVKSPRGVLRDVRVPDRQRVGEVGEAYVQRAKLQTGVNVPARGVGLARAALDDTVAYTSQREQFDHPIGDFQGVKWKVGEMAQRVDTARLLTLRAADRADRGYDTTREFSMAKVSATQAAVDNANEAMQLHGGIGYTTETHVERYLRDARLLTIAGGPNEGHKDTVAESVYADHPRWDSNYDRDI
ncbi:acyl-CoA dehydrogenase family protein [Halobellus limi]|uniref:Acyl-CoA dehydrogenase n=1 Tax=Halobellus limi TaxID=699433 RepID=A0A1H6BRT8_9EURY|nr:acyl-CoA dehydrogenase family protein [Halobellus limi]QCC49351.1 acyl-CoA dehydrogenase [Halobellus limi]SEG63404.1 Acyl-CoA dehydrogenase [Halobellus limi]